MTNPFPGPPEGRPPYEGASYQPYGGAPYGGNPYGGATPTTPLDGLSIAALVCSLTCCAAPVGVGLGIAGIVRTGKGKRRGRWAAVTGLVLGIVGLLVGAAAFVGLAWLGFNVAYEDELEVGDCVDTSSMFGDNDLWKATCDEPHDAEVFAAGQLGTHADDYAASRVDFCEGLIGKTPAGRSLLASGDYRADGSTDAISEDDPGSGNYFVCYLERTDGAKLDAPIGSSAPSRGA